MAVVINRNELTADQQAAIIRCLTFQPIVPFIPQQNHHFTRIQPTPITFWKATPTTVALPYFFAERLTGRPANRHLQHAKAPFKMKTEPLEHQKEVIAEAKEQLEKFGTTALKVYTGHGKTFEGATLIQHLGDLGLVLYHRNLLGVSWKKTFEEFTDAGVWIVGEPVPTHPVHVVLCMSTQVDKIPAEYRAKIGTLIIDEAHVFCAPEMCQKILMFQPRHIILETATFERKDGLHAMMQAVAGLHGITRIRTKPFHVCMYNTGITPPVEKTSMGTNWQVLQKHLAEHEGRNEMICQWVVANPQRKTLILTDLVTHARHLQELLTAKGIRTSFFAGTAKSYADAPVLVGTFSKIGTGFDEKMVCPDYNGVRIDCLMIVSSVKSLTRLEQGVGRAFRADMPYVIHFVDNNPTIQRHWKGCKPWYISRGALIQEVTLQKKVTVVLPDGSRKEVDA